MDDAPQPADLPANIRFLRVLVTALAVTMIAGLLTIVGLLVMRFSADTEKSAASAPAGPATAGLPGLAELAAGLDLPAGAALRSISVVDDLVIVVTEDARLLVLDRATGALRQNVALDRAE